MRDDRLMHLLRCLHYVEVENNFLLSVEHIPGNENTRADAISRKLFGFFRAEHMRVTGAPPNATPTSVVTPKPLVF